MLFAVVGPLGLPSRDADSLVIKPPSGGSYCGSEDMDKYFNSVCGNSVAKIASQCCGSNPAPVSCDLYRTACIDAHVKKGECESKDDCEAGCLMFNSIAATCCPHVLANSSLTTELSSADGRREKLNQAGHHGKQGKHGKKDGDKPPGVFWDTPDEEDYPEAGETDPTGFEAAHGMPASQNALGGSGENEFYCGAQASDDYFNDMCGWNSKDGAKLMRMCCPKEDMKIHTPGTGLGKDGERYNSDHMRQPPVCEEYRKSCVADHVQKGKCVDEATCFLGNQSFEQVAISCCTSPSSILARGALPPPSPPPPKRLCQDYFDLKDAEREKLRIRDPPPH